MKLWGGKAAGCMRKADLCKNLLHIIPRKLVQSNSVYKLSNFIDLSLTVKILYFLLVTFAKTKLTHSTNINVYPSLKDVCAMRGSDCGSSHYLICSKVQLQLHGAKCKALPTAKLNCQSHHPLNCWRIYFLIMTQRSMK